MIINNTVYQSSPQNTARILTFSAGKDITHKLYLRGQLHVAHKPLHTVMMADSGADINLISATYLKQTCPEHWKTLKEQMQPPDIYVSSYTNDQVPIAGYLNLNVSLVEHKELERLRFYVVKENVRVPCPVLIGEDAMVQLDLDTHNYLIDGEMKPMVTTMVGTRHVEVPSYYMTDQQFSRCISKKLYLQPGEMRRAAFYINEASPLPHNYKVLLTGTSENPSLLTIATKSRLERCGKTKRLFAMGVVCNTGDTAIVGTINAEIEDANNYKTYHIKRENKEKILKYPAMLDLDVNESKHFTYEGKFVLPDSAINQIQETDDASINIEHFTTEPHVTVNSLQPAKFPETVKLGHNSRAINNDVNNLDQSLTEERHNIQTDPPPADVDASQYHDPKTAVNLGLQEIKDDEFHQELLEHKGYYIPEDQLRSAKDVIEDLDLSEDVRPYIEKIFGKYDNTVSLHSMHRGNLTKYLGRYKLELKPGAKLPQHKRIYYLAPTESQLMKTILEFMIQNGTIEPASPRGDKLDMFSCSSFLVPRSDKNAIGRLVVDYSLLNKCLKQEPPAIPRLDHIIGQLRDSAFYSNLDLSQAFYSIELDPGSRELTRFATQFGFFNFKCLPTGVHSSPSLLERVLTHVVHYELVRDENGNIVWEDEANQIAKLKYSPMKHVEIFFDDLLVHTPYLSSYEESREFHFKILEELIKRISDHEGRLNLVKSTFFKTKLTYLGWNISHNHVSPDQRRIQKVLDFKVPGTQKGWKSFLGTVSSLRMLLGYDCLQHVSALTSLTSTRNKEKPTEKQLWAFEELKKQLVSSPLYCSIVLPAAPKICFVDSSQSAEGSFGAVLAQVIQPKYTENYIPTYLNLADPTHRMILDNDLPCIPAPWYLGKETEKEFRSKVNIDYPPESQYLEAPHFGLIQEQVPYTTTMALRTLFIIHSCSSDFIQICQLVAAELKKGMLRQQMLDFSFDKKVDDHKFFIKELQAGNILYDKGLYFYEALSKQLQRPITVISSLPEHSDQPIKTFNHEKKRPIFYFLLISNKYGVAVRPGYIDKDQCYNISQHRGSMEIIAYLSKSLPAAIKSCHILQLELYAVLNALHSFKKYIGTSELLVITDAKCLWYAYHNDVQDSSTKINRWTSKILDNFPNLRLGFCKSQSNISDFLSKEFQIKPPTTQMIKLPNFVDSQVLDLVDNRTFTIKEWEQFVNSKPGLIKHVETTKMKRSARISQISAQIEEDPYAIAPLMGHDKAVFAITRASKDKGDSETFSSSARNLIKAVKPVQLLSEMLSPENLQPKQREEYPDIYETALMSPNMKYTDGKVTYLLENGSLFRRKDNSLKLMVPPSLLAALISYSHLRNGHAGYHRLLLNMENYYCPLLRTKTETFCRACLPCALVNVRTAAETLAAYPTPSEVFLTAHLDYVEAMPPIRGFNHLLICTDILTGMVLVFPTKGKTAEEFIRTFLYNIQQHYSVQNILADNAKQFTSHNSLSTLQALGIRTIYTSSLSPMSKGNIERQVRNFKEACKKMLVSCEDYSWLLIAPYFTMMYNSSKLPRHGKSPFEMLYGEDSRLSQGVWPLVNYTPKPHPLLAKSEEYVTEQKDKIKSILKEAQQHLNKAKDERNKRLNKNKHTTVLEQGDLVFVKNHTVRPGTTLPLKSKYQLSFFTVLDPGKTTVMVKRELDDFVCTLHKSEVKKYVPHDEEFNDLPDDIKDVIMNLQAPESKLTDKDLHTLIKYENFEVPENAQIFHEEHTTLPMTSSEGIDLDPLPNSTAADDTQLENEIKSSKNKLNKGANNTDDLVDLPAASNTDNEMPTEQTTVDSADNSSSLIPQSSSQQLPVTLSPPMTRSRAKLKVSYDDTAAVIQDIMPSKTKKKNKKKI